MRELKTRIYTTSVTWDIETGAELWREDEVWRGPVERCKKGREAMGNVTQAGLANANTAAGRQTEQYGKLNPAIDQLTTVGANGLGLGASGYLNNQLASIGRTYGNARQNVARINAQRGFSATPEGAFQSGVNSANLAQAGDENKAYNDAQLMTRENMLAGINAREGLFGATDPNRSLNTALGGAEAQNKGGSLLGDIGQGLSAGVGLVTGVAGAKKAWS